MFMNATTLYDTYNLSHNARGNPYAAKQMLDRFYESENNILLDRFYIASDYVNLAVRIMGVITNPLILAVLSKQRIGSEATTVILMFLAVFDMGALLCNFFVYLTPYSKPLYFNLHWTPITCGLGFVATITVQISCSTYIIMVTLERFTVVYFPLKVMNFYTRRRAIICCMVIPPLWAALFSWWSTIYETHHTDGRLNCEPQVSEMDFFGKGYDVWCVLYLLTPAVVLPILNVAIILKLKNVNKRRESIAPSQRMRVGLRQSVSAASSLTSIATTVAGLPSLSSSPSRNSSSDSQVSDRRQMSGVRMSRSRIANRMSVRRATVLVLSTSIVFILLMLPKGMLYLIKVPTTDSKSTNDVVLVADKIISWCQYLNHSVNFFIYVLSNNKFRIRC